MEHIWNSGTRITLLVQSAGDWPAPLMKIASLSGTEPFYLLFLLVLYWCVDARVGTRFAFMMLLTDSVNMFFKLLFHHPRPYWYSSSVTAYCAENSFGLPSGHAQNSASLWGMLAVMYSARQLRIALTALILLIGLSRIYLGVHFYTDILTGWATGFALLAAVTKLAGSAAERLKGMSMPAQILLSVIASAAVPGILLIPLHIHSGWVFPEAWAANISAAIPGSAVPEPRRVTGIISVSGAILGYGAGLAVLHKKGGFRAEGSLRQKFLRMAIGLAGTAALYIGLKIILPQGGSVIAATSRYARYALAALWVMSGAPCIFIRLGLARKTG